MTKPSERFSCQTHCPRYLECIDEYDAAAERIEEARMSTAGRKVDQAMLDSEPTDTPKSAADRVRDLLARNAGLVERLDSRRIDRDEERMMGIVVEIGRLAADCPGPQETLADGNDELTKVYICDSPLIERGLGPRREPALVVRTDIE